MGNPDKRAKRAKSKAKSANIQRQRTRSSSKSHYEPSEKIIELFKKLPSPSEEQDCLALIHEHIENDPEGDFDDPEAAVMILYAMYKDWHTQKST